MICKWCNKEHKNKTFCSHDCRNAWTSNNNKFNNPVWDEATRMKMAASLTGKKHSKEVIERRKKSIAEARIKDPTLSARQSKAIVELNMKKPKGWARMRKLALQRDNNTCQNCDSRSKRVMVHHKDHQGRSLPKVSMMNNDIDNLITLCYGCHLSIHTWAVRRGEGPKDI